MSSLADLTFLSASFLVLENMFFTPSLVQLAECRYQVIGQSKVEDSVKSW